jgi:hypothetical protein
MPRSFTPTMEQPLPSQDGSESDAVIQGICDVPSRLVAADAAEDDDRPDDAAILRGRNPIVVIGGTPFALAGSFPTRYANTLTVIPAGNVFYCELATCQGAFATVGGSTIGSAIRYLLRDLHFFRLSYSDSPVAAHAHRTWTLSPTERETLSVFFRKKPRSVVARPRGSVQDGHHTFVVGHPVQSDFRRHNAEDWEADLDRRIAAGLLIPDFRMTTAARNSLNRLDFIERRREGPWRYTWLAPDHTSHGFMMNYLSTSDLFTTPVPLRDDGRPVHFMSNSDRARRRLPRLRQFGARFHYDGLWFVGYGFPDASSLRDAIELVA